MSDRLTGWLIVAVQAFLLIALVALPGGSAWPTPGPLRVLANVAVGIGLVVVVVAGLGLGPSLTPTPVPRRTGRLVTNGFYRWVRHPIYSAVLLIVVGLVLGSGSVARLTVGAITVAFFNAKAAWEERRLAARYPGYGAYAAVTPRFVPRLRSRPPAA